MDILSIRLNFFSSLYSKEPSKHGVDGGRKQTAHEKDTIKVETKEISKKSEKGTLVGSYDSCMKSYSRISGIFFSALGIGIYIFDSADMRLA